MPCVQVRLQAKPRVEYFSLSVVLKQLSCFPTEKLENPLKVRGLETILPQQQRYAVAMVCLHTEPRGTVRTYGGNKSRRIKTVCTALE